MSRAVNSASVPVDSLLCEAHRLRHFVVLAEERHYGKAAERLGMDQPSLSRSIVRLEQALGAQLLVRSARSLALTPAGEIFEKEARGLIAQAQLSSSIVRRVQDGEIGNLRIGFTPVAMFWALPEAVRRLRERFPDLPENPDARTVFVRLRELFPRQLGRVERPGCR